MHFSGSSAHHTLRNFFDATAEARHAAWPLRLLGTLIIASCGAALRYQVFGFGPGTPFAPFLPFVVLCAILFGWDAGILAGLISLAATLCFFIPHSPAPPLQAIVASSAVDFGVVLSLVFIVEALHDAYQEASRARIDAEAARAAAEAGERERELLLVELEHRMKNDLQRLSSLLALQARSAQPEAAAALQSAKERVETVARTHDRLARSDRAMVVDSQTFLSDFADDLRRGLQGLQPVTLDVEVEAWPLTLDRAGLVGLIVNELATNALKHAFPGDRQGTITIRFYREEQDFVLMISDDGVGLTRPSASRPGGLGRRLIDGLSKQLGGRCTTWSGPGAGTVTSLRFPGADLAPANDPSSR
ncbi:histidine kinase dimerization/phosphoacceptor domain -containing protein [Paracraurococcus lichenis]|uniref:histidine kinase n=1 Tax=Paracraurococcus lichenis TaxID=3064888 RepID=A0ABT9E8T5_9PROT|nr:histidine kinase dimerization/phosphoacceptor domain -containing protein [Paracraurococcus sp. LOR1-02]MDO9712611.1 histidine kinase dimerization/phosphoacceptor domain -containing protein [Paracraurococcus sp. LOR1-02]